MTANTVPTQSHRVLGTLWHHSLTQVQILVSLEPKLLGDSPRADVLLLRRAGDAWNTAQRARLPDGVRDNAAGHVLVEFKYSESVNESALAQAVAYDHFYRQGQMLSEEEVMTVLLSAKTPRIERLTSWAYAEVEQGVYRSPLPLLQRVWLLVLNELEPHPHNAYVKIFASRAEERETAFAALDMLAVEETADLQSYILGLRTTMKEQGEDEMNSGLTPEKIKEIGEQLRDFVLATTKPENVSETLRRRILETTTPEERLAGLDVEERLAGLDVEERLAGMSAAERRALLRLLQEELGTGASEEARGNGGGV